MISHREILKSLLQHNHPNPKDISLEDKVKLINRIIEVTSFDAKQGSKEWAEGRQIGGSDAAAMIGKGYNGKGPYDVIKGKFFPETFSGNLATRFGKIFEDVGRLIVQKIFQHNVWEFKSLPNKLEHTTFSPDGVTIACILKKLMLILLEFKTPLSRIPDGKIPKEYLPQVKAGMCAIPFVDGALFVNTMLRLCSLKDFGYNFNYNTRLHKQDITTCKTRLISHKDKLNEVLALGMVVLIQTDINRSNVKEHFDDNNQEDGKVIDSGGKSYVVFDTGPSFEDELLKTDMLDGDRAIQSIYSRHKSRNMLYTKFKHYHQNLDIPNFTENYENSIFAGKTERNDELFKLFQSALLNSNEKEFGSETENDTAKMFEYIEEEKFLKIQHIPPYLVNKNIDKIPLLREYKISSEYPTHESDEYITHDAWIYFIEHLNRARQDWEGYDIHIAGVIPYKIFKLDLVYIPNNEPNWMECMRMETEKYGKIKSEIEALVEEDLNEKNQMKHNIILNYFPEKKQTSQLADYQSVESGLANCIAQDDSLF